MSRVLRIALLLVLALALPASASGAARMWVGFQDDPYFRWAPDRDHMRTRAMQANATILRTTISWYRVAPRRPSNPANPFDSAYQWADIDELVRGAQARGLEVMFTIYGTPRWANGGRPPNRMPRRLADMTNFARAVATRYSGRYEGLPFVRFYTVWNEANLGLFLMPQFDAKGRSVGPANYARLYRAAYAGIKRGNPQALVGAGVTSHAGRDRKKAGVSDTHSPGRFAELVSKARPRIRFDAWAHHPYPVGFTLPPTQVVRWPNVTLTTLPRFGAALDRWFKRRNIPIWITEYGHETRPEEPRGVSYTTQASYLRTAMSMMRSNPRVQMVIWFVMRDHPGGSWESGLLTQFGLEKPAFDLYSVLARPVDARNPILRIAAGRAPTLRASALRLAYTARAGTRVGITYRVFLGGRLIAVRQPESRIDRDGWVTFRADFTPQARRTYTVEAEINDPSGNRVTRTFTLNAR